jgi:hypothetical protein
MRKYLIAVIIGLLLTTGFASSANAYGHKIYKDPKWDPNINPNRNSMTNPKLNPYMNPNLNPYMNPNLNPYMNPKLNPKPRR